MVSLAEVADRMMGLDGALVVDASWPGPPPPPPPWFPCSTDFEGMDAWRASRLPLAALKRELKRETESSEQIEHGWVNSDSLRIN